VSLELAYVETANNQSQTNEHYKIADNATFTKLDQNYTSYRNHLNVAKDRNDHPEISSVVVDTAPVLNGREVITSV